MQRCVWLHMEPLDTFACEVAKRQALWPAVSVPYLSIEGTGTNMFAGFPRCEICVTYGETWWNAVKWRRRTPTNTWRLHLSGCWHSAEAWRSWTWLDQATARIGFGAPADRLVSSNHQRFLPSEIRPDPASGSEILTLTLPNGRKHCGIIGSRDKLKFLSSSQGSHIFTPPSLHPNLWKQERFKKTSAICCDVWLGNEGLEWTGFIWLICRESFSAWNESELSPVSKQEGPNCTAADLSKLPWPTSAKAFACQHVVPHWSNTQGFRVWNALDIRPEQKCDKKHWWSAWKWRQNVYARYETILRVITMYATFQSMSAMVSHDAPHDAPLWPRFQHSACERGHHFENPYYF